ncbi:MAG: nucleotidyltransferase family protein [Nitrospiraceae bacterium]|nr:nucleotidyltransferase family protein [Nitrospiraceae bacterium]
MGRLKQLLPVKGKPAVRCCAETLVAAGIADIVAVVSAEGDDVAEALNGLPVRIVRNRNPMSDMAGSVRTGLRALGGGVTGVVVLPADHPLVQPSSIADLLHEHIFSPRRIILLLHKGRRGHPTLFPRPVIDETLDGYTLRDVIDRHAGQIRMIVVDDEGAVLDMDTPPDYERLLRFAEEGMERGSDLASLADA